MKERSQNSRWMDEVVGEMAKDVKAGFDYGFKVGDKVDFFSAIPPVGRYIGIIKAIDGDFITIVKDSGVAVTISDPGDIKEVIESPQTEMMLESELKKKAAYDTVEVTWDTTNEDRPKGSTPNLPKRVLIPTDVHIRYLESEQDPAVITDYLSDTFGYLVSGWYFIDSSKVGSLKATAEEIPPMPTNLPDAGKKWMYDAGVKNWILVPEIISPAVVQAEIKKSPESGVKKINDYVNKAVEKYKNEGFSETAALDLAADEAMEYFGISYETYHLLRTKAPVEKEADRSPRIYSGDNFYDYLKAHDLDCELIIGGAEMPASFVWDHKINDFTEEGKKQFAPILNARFEILRNGNIEVFADSWELGELFVMAASGNISETTYDKWFVDEYSVQKEGEMKTKAGIVNIDYEDEAHGYGIEEANPGWTCEVCGAPADWEMMDKGGGGPAFYLCDAHLKEFRESKDGNIDGMIEAWDASHKQGSATKTADLHNTSRPDVAEEMSMEMSEHNVDEAGAFKIVVDHIREAIADGKLKSVTNVPPEYVGQLLQAVPELEASIKVNKDNGESISTESKLNKKATAHSELFVDEVVFDIAREKYPELKGLTLEIPDDWRDIWEANEYPSSGEANVFNENGAIIGQIKWTVRFSIEIDPNSGSRYIEAEPKKIEFVRTGPIQEKLPLKESYLYKKAVGEDVENAIAALEECLNDLDTLVDSLETARHAIRILAKADKINYDMVGNMDAYVINYLTGSRDSIEEKLQEYMEELEGIEDEEIEEEPTEAPVEEKPTETPTES